MLIAASPEQIQTPTAIALGNFDGIHQGHQVVLQPIIDVIQPLQQPHIYSSVVSFTPHPREFFSGGKLQFLTPIDEKAEQLSTLGIEQLILLHFDRDLASLTPEQFVEQIIVQQLQAKVISVGSDFRFGHRRRGTAEDLKNIASAFGITVHLNSLHQYQNCNQPSYEVCSRLDTSATQLRANAMAESFGLAESDDLLSQTQPLRQSVRVSSSLIRQALKDGEIDTANTMLGRPYRLKGTVVTGQQLGRTIGFPTANLELPPEKFLPRYGVYAVNVLVNGNLVKGVMNIGCRPTVAGDAPTIEVHLLNWSGDLYGQTLKVDLLQFLRPERKFDSVEALKQQITKDCQAVLNNP